MPEPIQSNLIIKARVTKPNLQGFRDIRSGLSSLEKRLKKITDRTYTLKFKADMSAIEKLSGRNIQNAVTGRGQSGQGGQGTGQGAGQGGQQKPPSQPRAPIAPPRSPAGFNFISRTEAEGRVTDVFKRVIGSIEETITETTKQSEEGQKTSRRLERKNLDEEIDHQKNKKTSQAEIKRLDAENAEIARTNAKREKQSAELYRKNVLDAKDAESRAVAKRERQSAQFYKNEVLGQQDQITRERQKLDKQAANKHKKAVLSDIEFQERRRQFIERQRTLEAAGFRKGASSQAVDNAGRVTNKQQFFRTSGSVFTGNLAVEVQELDEKMGRLNKKLLRGGQAVRFLGDSMANAVAKVALWVGATTIVFGAVQAIGFLARETIELERNTVFLARVMKEGQGDFEVQIQLARQLTDEILDLSVATGISATESQRAAAIFLRTTKTNKEALEGVRAALIASKIAELEVEDAANLLSAALAQFNLEAGELLPTLDRLNTLSNTYRVTTDDLLQAIGRTGSVYAEHNGTLTELAAITSQVSERTARSGAQIGNALKTVQSRLDRVDLRRDIFETLGVSMETAEGEAQSLIKVLVSLNLALDEVSDTEARRLNIDIAGVRQKNLFIAALKESTNSIIAQNVALLKNSKLSKEGFSTGNIDSSSIEEFIADANTSGAAIERLINQLTEFVNVLSSASAEGITPLIVTLTSAIGYLTDFLDLFLGNEGIIGTISRTTLIIGLLTAGLLGVNRQFGVYAAVGSLAAKTTGSLTAATAFYSASANTATVSTYSLAGALTVLKGSAGAISLALTVATVGVSYLISESAKLDQIQDAISVDSDYLNNQISAQKEFANVIRNSQFALIQYGIALEEAIAKGQTERVANLRKEVTRLRESLNLETDSNVGGVKGAVAGFDEFSIRQAKQVKETGEARIGLLNEERLEAEKELEEAKSRVAEYESNANRIERAAARNARAVARGQRTIGTAPQVEAKIRGRYVGFLGANEEGQEQLRALDTGGANLKAKLIEARRALAEINGELKEFKEQQEELAELKLTDEDEAVRIQKLIDKQALLNVEYLRTSELNNAIGENPFEIKNVDKMVDRFNELESRLRATKKTLEATPEAFRSQALIEQAQGDAKKLIQLEKEYANFAKAKRSESFRGQYNFRSSLADTAALSTFRENDLDNPDLTRGLRESDAQITQKRLQLLAVENERRRLEATGNADDGSLTGLNQGAQDLTLELRELEAGKAEQLLTIEEKIAKARKESAEQIQSAVSGLSEEDKLRALILAQEFKDNPDRKVSASEFFFADSTTQKLLEQAGRAPDFTKSGEQGDAIGSLLGGFFSGGREGDLSESEAEAKKFRAGRSDQEIIDQAAEARADNRNLELGLQGNNTPQITDGLGQAGDTSNTAGAQFEFDFNVDNTNFDFTQVVDALADSLEDKIVEAEDRLEARWRQLQEGIPAGKKPPTQTPPAE